MRRLVSVLAVALATLAAGCVSSRAGRAEAESILAERLPAARDRPDDGETREARAALLGRPLTADAAARLAVLHHPEVDAAFAAIGVARGQLVGAVTLPNPEVELEVKLHDGQASWDLGASIDVTELLRLASREAAASAALEAAAVDAVGRVMDVALEARRAWFAYVAARQITELRRTAAFAFAQSADAAQRIFEAGNSPALSVAQERAGFEEARLLVSRAEIEELSARERLSAAMGLFGEEASRWQVGIRLRAKLSGSNLTLNY